MLAACGGSAKPAAASTNNGGGATGIQAYVTCLNQHGVKIALPSGGPRTRPSGGPTGPGPSFSPGGGFGGGGFGGGGFGGGDFGGIFGGTDNPPAGVSQSTWSAALSACKSVQPSFARSSSGPNNTAFQAYLNCLRSHGVTASAGPNAINASDPTTGAAMKTCAPLRPTGRPSESATVAPSPSA
jgi:hypothetical protein